MMKETSFTGEVVSVDKSRNTCIVDEDGIEHLEVRLVSVVNKAKNVMVIYPLKGSQVTCTLLHNDYRQCQVIGYTEVEQFLLPIKDSIFEIKEDLIKIHSGGKVQIKNSQVNQKDIISGLIQVVAAIVVIQGVGPDIAELIKLKQDLELLMD